MRNYYLWSNIINSHTNIDSLMILHDIITLYSSKTVNVETIVSNAFIYLNWSNYWNAMTEWPVLETITIVIEHCKDLIYVTRDSLQRTNYSHMLLSSITIIITLLVFSILGSEMTTNNIFENSGNHCCQIPGLNPKIQICDFIHLQWLKSIPKS